MSKPAIPVSKPGLPHHTALYPLPSCLSRSRLLHAGVSPLFSNQRAYPVLFFAVECYFLYEFVVGLCFFVRGVGEGL